MMTSARACASGLITISPSRSRSISSSARSSRSSTGGPSFEIPARGEVHFQLKSDTHYLAELNHLLSSLYLYSGLSQEQAQHLTMAVSEMGTNAIEWGNRKQVDQPVTITYRIDPEKVTIVIRDSGPGFDRSKLKHAAKLDDPTSHLDVRESMGIRVGGFGILMTKGLVDELEYNQAGNEVTLVKRFTSQPVPADRR